MVPMRTLTTLAVCALVLATAAARAATCPVLEDHSCLPLPLAAKSPCTITLPKMATCAPLRGGRSLCLDEPLLADIGDGYCSKWHTIVIFVDDASRLRQGQRVIIVGTLDRFVSALVLSPPSLITPTNVKKKR